MKRTFSGLILIGSFVVLASAGAAFGGITLSPSSGSWDGDTVIDVVASSDCGVSPPRWSWSASAGSIRLQGGDLVQVSIAHFTLPNALGSYTIQASEVGCAAPGTATLQVNRVMTVSINPFPPLFERQSYKPVVQTTYGGVNWTIDDPNGGSFDVWSDPYLSATFTAGWVPGTYQVTAQSIADPKVQTSTTFQVLTPQISISPTSALIAAGSTANFAATVSNVQDTTTDWSTTCNGNVAYATGYPNAVTLSTYANGGGGPCFVEATIRATGTFATASVNVVGVTISPSSPAVDVGTGIQFRAVVGGATNQNVTWSTTVPSATINSAGFLQLASSTTPGTYSVKATTAATPTASASVSVVVHPVTIGSVAVSPGSPTVGAGAKRQFAATVYSDTNLALSGERVGLTASAGSISSNGVWTAPFAAGTYAVTATSSRDTTKSAMATITVPATLTVAPTFASLTPGASQQFSATALGVSGSLVWRVVEAGGGVVPNGLYTAPATPGVYHVVVSSVASPSVDATATVQVSTSAGLSVDVTPDGVEMSRGATQQFSAVVEGSANQAVHWAATGGTIDGATGSFTAPNSYGTVTVTATSLADSRAVGSATVVVSDGSVGQSFTYDANGNLLSDGVRAFEWDAENRLTAVTSGAHRSEFGYDGFGRRVLITEKDSGSITSRKRYIWVGNSIAQELSSPVAAGFAAASLSTASAVTTEAFESADPSAGGETPRTRETTVSPTYQGSFDAADCTTISGWAWDMNQTNTSINVDIYDNNTFLTSVPANIYSAALVSAGKGNGYHAFAWTVPASLKNGTAHAIYVRYGGTYTALPNSPRSITCSSANYQGSLDAATCSSIDGWAWDSTQPNGTVNVDVLDGATVLATVPANVFRQDLQNAGIGNGYHGFHLNPPSSVIDGKGHSISARVTGSTYTLPGTPKSITCTPPSTTPLAAKFVSQSVPTSMAPGGVYSVSITFQNTGTNAWTKANNYRLGDASPTPGTWNLVRVDLGAADYVATGQSKTFTFNVLAPSAAGTYNFQWRMVQEFVAWFGDLSPNVAIAVSGNPPRNATFVSQSVPTTVGAGESFPISITMKNTGANSWTVADSYRLGDQSPNSPAISWGRSRVDLSATDSIANGQTKTFTFTATAPSTAGSYQFQWRMLQELVAWFGDMTPAVTIRVMPPVASSTATEWVTAEFYPGGMRADGANYYFLHDQLGSVRRVYDGTSALTSAFDYDPWGRVTVAAGASLPKFGYAGYFYHPPSGLWLTKYRAYDPDLGHWLSPDPAEEDADENLYRYSNDDPVNESDPLGLKCAPKHAPKHPKHPKHKKPPKKLPRVPLNPKGPSLCLMCRSPQVPLPHLPTTLPPLPWPPPYVTGYPWPPWPNYDPNAPTVGPDHMHDFCVEFDLPCADERDVNGRREHEHEPDPFERHHNGIPRGVLPRSPGGGLPPVTWPPPGTKPPPPPPPPPEADGD